MSNFSLVTCLNCPLCSPINSTLSISIAFFSSPLSLVFFGNHSQIISNQSRSCTAWNISLHEYNPVEDEKMHAGAVIHQFCPRDKHKQFTLPWNMRTIVIRVQAMTRQAPLYTFRWKSITQRQKVQSLTPAPNVISSSDGSAIMSSITFKVARILILSLLHFTIICFM